MYFICLLIYILNAFKNIPIKLSRRHLYEIKI
jgi:hypothetical protein